MALARSTSMPVMVLLSLPMNSFGAYDGSVATVSVPLLLIAAGTVIEESALAEADADALGLVLELLLLPQAARESASPAAVKAAAPRPRRDATWKPFSR